jgi:hypothetical protein
MFKKIWNIAYQIATGLGIALCCSALLLMANPARINALNAIPGDSLSSQSLSSFGKFDEGGSFAFPQQAVADFGTDHVSWEAGQKPADTLPIGIWNTAFKIGQLSTAQINKGQDMESAGLDNYKFLKQMPVADLVKGIPNLANMKINAVPAIKGLVEAGIASGKIPPTINIGGIEIPITKIGDLVTNRDWASTPIGANGNNTSALPASSIPGLSTTPLSKFPGIMANPASKIPGLPQMPIVEMPGFGIPTGYSIGKADLIRTKEPVRRKVISGSKETPNAQCLRADCNHLEIQGIGNPLLKGAQIVDGDKQSVSGGYGILKMVAGGIEKVGLQPYGEPIQEVYSGFNAKKGTFKRSWYFNYCNHGMFDLGCTPHFIGPIPIGSLKEGNSTPLLLGNVSIPMTVPSQVISAIPIPRLPALPGLPGTSPSRSQTSTTPNTISAIPTAPAAATTTTTSATNPDLGQLSTSILKVLPNANPTQVNELLTFDAALIDPVTMQRYKTEDLTPLVIQQLISGVNSKDGTPLSLSIGTTVEDIVAKVKANGK